jgi:hypothetical protein
MELALSVLGIVLAIAIAAWEYLRAIRAEAALDQAFRALPGQLVHDLSRIIAKDPSDSDSSAENSGLVMKYADLNGDGKDEMLVTYMSGPHSTSLQVYGKKNDWEFGLLGEILGQTPTDFDLEDVDQDGILEVSVVEVAKRPDLPYVMGLRDKVSYKLQGEGFVEVRRIKEYSTDDLKAALSDWHSEGDT